MLAPLPLHPRLARRLWQRVLRRIPRNRVNRILRVVENILLPFALAEAEPVVQRFFDPEAWGGDEEPCADDVRFVDGESQRERGGEDDEWLDPKVQDHFCFGGHGEFQQAHHADGGGAMCRSDGRARLCRRAGW
jgi:hypothetical protein